MMSVPVWLPGPMFCLQGCIQVGLPPGVASLGVGTSREDRQTPSHTHTQSEKRAVRNLLEYFLVLSRLQICC